VRLAGLVISAALGGLLTGGDLPGQSSTPTPSATRSRATACVVSATGHNAAITFSGASAGTWCQRMISAGPGGYDFGVAKSTNAVCRGQTNDGTTYVVTDSGTVGTTFGDTMCSQVQRLVFGGSPAAS
jgi:hypothetical protein